MELIVHKEPALLDNFLDVSMTFLFSKNLLCFAEPSDFLQQMHLSQKVMSVCFTLQEMLAFQSDRAAEVKKFIITFIEEAW